MSHDLGSFTIFRCLYSILLYCVVFFRVASFFENFTSHCLPLHAQKRASCSKSAITKPMSGCVRIACSGLMITSLLKVVNRLAASCELHTGLMQVISSTCSKSANTLQRVCRCSYFRSLNSYFQSLNSYFQSLNSYFQSLNSYFRSFNSYFQSLN